LQCKEAAEHIWFEREKEEGRTYFY